jgi:cytochrome b pre-mRNA-processing protein 3
MIFSLFRKPPQAPLVAALHARIDAAVREPALYLRLNVPDTAEGRFETLALHMVLVLRTLRRLPPPAEDVAQDVVDSFFRQLDASLREMGVGDMGVPKRMKKLAQAFYGRAAAYDAALDSGDPDRVANVLAEAFGQSPEALRGLARYALAAEAALAGLSLDDLLGAGPRFPAPAELAEEVAQLTPESVGPLSRTVSVRHLPPEGLEVTVEPTPDERAALAKDLKLLAIHALEGRLRLTGTPERVHVEGAVRARVTQTCVVTLEDFEDSIEEEVEVDFAPGASAAGEAGADDEPPDEIAGGHVDLGALTAEFLALGLDPYPRKPGAEFSFEGQGDEAESPFAALRKLKPSG